MWFRMLSRGDERRWSGPAAAAAVALALAAGGCSSDYVENNQASVLLLVEAVNAGAPLLSDVRGGDNGDSIINCFTDITVSVRGKNPTQPTQAVQDVRVTRYEVVWRRSDGRGTEGVDVPYRTSGNVTLTVGVGQKVTFSLDLVRHQAKLVPPLSNITGLQVVTMFADVTVTGETISGQAVSGQGTVQVTFADYATGTTTCESGS